MPAPANVPDDREVEAASAAPPDASDQDTALHEVAGGSGSPEQATGLAPGTAGGKDQAVVPYSADAAESAVARLPTIPENMWVDEVAGGPERSGFHQDRELSTRGNSDRDVADDVCTPSRVGHSRVLRGNSTPRVGSPEACDHSIQLHPDTSREEAEVSLSLSEVPVMSELSGSGGGPSSLLRCLDGGKTDFDDLVDAPSDDPPIKIVDAATGDLG